MLTKQNERKLNSILRDLRTKAKKSWYAKNKLQYFWGEQSDNDARDGENSGEHPYGY